MGCRPNRGAPEQLDDVLAELQGMRSLSHPGSSGFSPAAWPGKPQSPQWPHIFYEPVLIGSSAVTTWSTALGMCASISSGYP